MTESTRIKSITYSKNSVFVKMQGIISSDMPDDSVTIPVDLSKLSNDDDQPDV